MDSDPGNAAPTRVRSRATALILLFFNLMAFGFPVEVANAPGSNLALTLRAIRTAKRSLSINIYEFTSPEIAQALVDRINEGVQVRILEEGQPVGGFGARARAVEERLVQAMDDLSGGGDAYYLMRGSPGISRRYHYDHAKYIVVDEEALLLGSENYSPSGEPAAGAKGNRGWQVFVSEPTLAGTFARLFLEDCNTRYGDLVSLRDPNPMVALAPLAGVALIGLTLPKLRSGAENKTAKRLDQSGQSSPEAPWRSDAQAARALTSPHSLQGLLELVGSSKKTLDIELMSFPPTWGGKSKPSPLLEAVTAAARRGVRVRALLNNEAVFDRGSSSGKRRHQNPITVRALNALRRDEGLDVSARIAKLKEMGVTYIHNKGALIDGEKALISSINWTRNSVENNREAAVILTGREIHDYYGKIFERDWALSQ